MEHVDNRVEYTVVLLDYEIMISPRRWHTGPWEGQKMRRLVLARVLLPQGF